MNIKRISPLIFFLICLIFTGCSDPLRFNGIQVEDYEDIPMPIDFFIHSMKTPKEAIQDWVVCGGSITGGFIGKVIEQSNMDFSVFQQNMYRCLGKKNWIYRFCYYKESYRKENFCKNYSTLIPRDIKKKYFFKTYYLWQGSNKKMAFKACHAQEGRFWEPIVGAYIDGIRDTSKSFNLERVVSDCLLKQGLMFQACPQENKLRVLFNEAAGGVEICPIQP